MKIKLIYTLNLCVMFLCVGCQQPTEKPTPTYDVYPNPTEHTEYEQFEDGLLLWYGDYNHRDTDGYQGEYIECADEVCTHGEVYTSGFYFLVNGDLGYSDRSKQVYMWLESESGDAQIHSNRVAGGSHEYVGIDENGYFYALIHPERSDKFVQSYTTSFWLQVPPSTVEKGYVIFRIRAYDSSTGVYYESEQYRVDYLDNNRIEYKKS